MGPQPPCHIMTKAQKSSVATSPRKQSVQISKQNLDTINHTQDGTTTSSQKLKPQLKITRNNLGTAVFVFFGIFFDLVQFLIIYIIQIFSTCWDTLIIIQTCMEHSRHKNFLVLKSTFYSLLSLPLSVQFFQSSSLSLSFVSVV